MILSSYNQVFQPASLWLVTVGDQADMKNDATVQPLKYFLLKNLSQETLKINVNSNILGW